MGNVEESVRNQVSDSRNIGELARKHGGRTRRLVMQQFRKQEYRQSIANELDKRASTIQYHIDQLIEDDLIEKKSSNPNSPRTWYQLTELGNIVLNQLNEVEL